MRIPTAVALLALALLAHPASAAEKPKARVIQMEVTPDGFVPSEVKVKKGEPLELVVTRKTDKTCATEIVIKDYGVNEKLPLGKPVTVHLTPTKSGTVRYACGMDMISGQLVVE
ncbi:MAG TPA: cupredoxin domain-containing protein [Anaeromyxobacter sp.]|nr:cupredoxin domain-containing protein [Anaeromyxobacter sp.]